MTLSRTREQLTIRTKEDDLRQPTRTQPGYPPTHRGVPVLHPRWEQAYQELERVLLPRSPRLSGHEILNFYLDQFYAPSLNNSLSFH